MTQIEAAGKDTKKNDTMGSLLVGHLVSFSTSGFRHKKKIPGHRWSRDVSILPVYQAEVGSR